MSNGESEAAPSPEQAVRVGEIAYGRSGDKANTFNIGIIAESEAAYRRLDRQLTADRVAALFDAFVDGSVTRYRLPNLLGFNFVASEALDGGGQFSLRYDSQGKTYAAAVLQLELPPESSEGRDE
ncbi:AtuA-related protein [Haloplanus ruber]|uniref:AtuA-like ferredoxin-fold domain-containing protein n=1 Tax=Haloplanus ruber TaxID=869892 RepID=A0ABD6CZ85_9EURY|nr:hypothetical protein [Haloplanus ruber]